MATTTNTNIDLQPTLPSQRTSTAWETAALWLSMAISIPSYYSAGSLVDQGMTWYQALATVAASQLILLFPLLLTAYPAALYGVPLPVLARSAFGVRGAHVASLLRTLVACGWCGIETWLGGQAIFILLPSHLAHSGLADDIPWLGTSPLELSCFAVYWILQMAVLWRGMRGVRELGNYSAPVLVVLLSVLLIWAYTKAGGFGPILSQPSTLSPAQFWALFFPSLTASVGNWAAMAVSIPDFARYSRTYEDNVLGQLGFPLFYTSFVFVGLAVTSSTVVIFGRPISNPIDLIAAIGSTLVKVLAVPGIFLALITTNIPANIVAPANALVSLGPSVFSFKTGALVTALIGAVVFQPWRILESSDSFVYTWLVSYSSVMGALSGVLLTDYYLIRRMVLNVRDLYSDSHDGEYYYAGGYNVVGIACLVLAVLPVVPGFLHKVKIVKSVPGVFVFIYNIGWFFGLFVGGMLYGVTTWCVNGRFRGSSKIKAEVATKRSSSPMSVPLLG